MKPIPILLLGLTALVVMASSGASWNCSVTKNVLPTFGSLSTQILPPIKCVRREEIANPKPVPPKRRVMDESACSNSSKILAHFSAGIPMPVSRTATCSVAVSVDSD